jgi:hypothetical protein
VTLSRSVPAQRGGPATAIGIAVALAFVVALLVSWFAWPAKELAPRDLPVVVAGPAPAATAIADQLRAAEPGAFEITTVADGAAADAALRDREAYAAFIAGPSGLALHTASGASPVVAMLLGQAAQQMAGESGRPVEIVDVVPGSPDDPRGAGFAAGLLPLVLAGMVAGIVLALLVPARTARFAGVAVFAVLAGLAGAAVLHWLGLIGGSFLAAAGGITLLALAVSAAVAGLASLLGPPGIGLAVLVIFLLGNPISAVAAAPELLPQPWGSIGQFLPPGAGASLLRSLGFFDGAGLAVPLWTLVAWAAVGLALLATGRTRTAAEAKL